ncbi:MAG: amidohydrolase family protein [Rhodospirillaceae bacterium]|jgi:predicted TIM-barrel fold metal-dependent hydrolase
MSGYIDIVCNPYTPWVLERKLMGVDEDFKTQVRMSDDMRNGVEIEDYIKKMDAAGIERSLLIAHRCGDLNVKGSHHIPYEYVRDICEKYPDRFSGLAGIDTTKGMEQLRELEAAINDYGFVGAHWYPHWFGVPPDAPQIYPVYAKCCELDIPIMMQVGQNLVYSKERRLPSVAKPILLDQVAIDFPELPLIGIHIGVPWTDEMIAMCWKHENLYMAGDAYAPKHWPKQMVHYANSYGRHKVMFGTDWPVVGPERAVREVDEFGMRPEAHQMLMRDNALRLFKKIAS